MNYSRNLYMFYNKNTDEVIYRALNIVPDKGFNLIAKYELTECYHK